MSTSDRHPACDSHEAKKVVVALSGGVDSAVAASLLQEAGHEVTGLFIDTQIAGPHSGGSSGEPSAAEQVRRIGDHLGIPVDVLSAGADFERDVLRPFAAEYARGRTPNPCVLCNRVFKFRHLLAYADAHQTDRIATGHYARVGNRDGRPTLFRGLDADKDQSYYLHRLGPDVLARLVLPLGELDKDHVRESARRRKLPVLDRPESQDVCFAGEGTYADRVARYFPDALTPGDVLDIEGRVVGRHEGLAHVTIGQRKGLGIAMGHPAYVADIDVESNTVTLAPRQALLRDRLTATEVTWLVEPAGLCLRASAQVRYRHRAAEAEIRLLEDDAVEVRFDEPQWAITPGQAVVFYDGATVLGGGWIDRASSKPA